MVCSNLNAILDETQEKLHLLLEEVESLYIKQSILEEKMEKLEEKLEEIENRVKRLETESIFLMENVSSFYLRENITLFPKAYKVSKLNAPIFEEEEERLPFRKF